MKKIMVILSLGFIVVSSSFAERFILLTEEQKQSPEFLELKSKAPLIAALFTGASENEIRELIKTGINPNSEEHYGQKPLHTAIKQENTGAVKALIEGGADVNFLEKDDASPLQIAAFRGNVPIAQMLIDHGAKLNYIDPTTKDTLLGSAVMGGNIKMIQFLLDKGLDINAKNYAGNTPLTTAISLGEYPEIVKLLLSRSANFDNQQLLAIAKDRVRYAEEYQNEEWAKLPEKKQILEIVEKAVAEKNKK